MSCVTNEQIAEARKQLNKIRANAELMERIRLEEAYEMDENTRIANKIADAEKIGEKRGKIEGIEIGEKRGEKRGEERTKLETAKKMLDKNMDINLISELTELSIDEIKKLSNE